MDRTGSADFTAAPLSGGASVDLGVVDTAILDVVVSGGQGLLLASDGERVFADVEHNASEEIVVVSP